MMKTNELKRELNDENYYIELNWELSDENEWVNDQWMNERMN